MRKQLLPMLALSLGLGACQTQKWTETECDGYKVVSQKGGATLGYAPASGIHLIFDKGFAFKDLNRNGILDPYEDWRQPVEKRVKDLARQLSVEEIAGLMLYSNHQAIPATSYDVSTYDGKPYSAGEANPFVPAEIEPLCDALFITFDIQNQVILDFVSGKREPSGLLPMQMPADMDTVEEQAEDTPRDMRCYTDADGNTYDFAFGLNWKGIINDKHVQQYR